MYKEDLYQINSNLDTDNHRETTTNQRFRMHTGPTTSPENSYTILLQSSNNGSRIAGESLSIHHQQQQHLSKIISLLSSLSL